MIRKETFQTQRYNEDFIPYELPGVVFEHPLGFYPSHPIKSYPKQYVVFNNLDLHQILILGEPSKLTQL